MANPVRHLFVFVLLGVFFTAGSVSAQQPPVDEEDEFLEEDFSSIDEEKKPIPRYDRKPTQRMAKGLKKNDQMGIIVIMTNFEEASVKIDAEEYEAHLKDGLLVKAGVEHQVTVDWEGGPKKSFKVRLRNGEARVILVDLSNKSVRGPTARPTQPRDQNQKGKQQGVGFISVNSNPPGQVYIDGQLVSSETPLVKYEVTPGQHAVRVYYPDLSKYSETKKAVIHKGNHINLYFQGNRNQANPNPNPQKAPPPPPNDVQPYYDNQPQPYYDNQPQPYYDNQPQPYQNNQPQPYKQPPQVY